MITDKSAMRSEYMQQNIMIFIINSLGILKYIMAVFILITNPQGYKDQVTWLICLRSTLPHLSMGLAQFNGAKPL